jgi:hypothetical protein
MALPDSALVRMHRALVEALRERDPSALAHPFTVAEVYQDLIPYRTHRDRLGVEMNGDYEHLLLRLLAGEGELVSLGSEPARRELTAELEEANPNTGLYREYAGVDVRLVPDRIPDDLVVDVPRGDAGPAGEEPALSLMKDAGPDAPLPEPHLFGDRSGVETSPAPPQDDDADVPGRPDVSQGTHRDAATVPEADDGIDAGASAGAAVPAAAAATDDDDGSCRWCRAELPRRDNLNYCPYCGQDVRVVPCPSCGEAMEPDWRFCIACGAEATPA